MEAPSAEWLASSAAYRRRAKRRARRINRLLRACERRSGIDGLDLRLRAAALMAEDICDQRQDLGRA